MILQKGVNNSHPFSLSLKFHKKTVAALHPQSFVFRMNCNVHFFSYSIKNATEESVDIFIDGDIVDASTQQFYKEWFGDDTTTSYKSFRDQLKSVDAKVYNVYINSGGGVVTDAMAIHDLLKEMQNQGKTVNTIGRGLIASAATYILMAGKTPKMSKNSWFMIHNVSGFVWGDVDQVEKYYNTLRKFNNRSRDFYAEATGKSKDDIEQMMKEETWLTADEAREMGFISVVEGEAQFEQHIPAEKWIYNNKTVLNAYNSFAKKNADPGTQLTQKFDDMKKWFSNLAEGIMNAIKKVEKPANDSHEALMENIGKAVSQTISQASEKVEEELSTSTKNSFTEYLKTEEFKNSVTEIVKQAVTEAIDAKPDSNFSKAVNALVEPQLKKLVTEETVNQIKSDFETEITSIKGNKTTTENPANSAAPLGGFSGE